MSLELKLDKIRSPKLENQRETAVILAAVETTLQEQSTQATPTAYFAALLSLLAQAVSSTGEILNGNLANSSVYLLDIVTAFVPPPLLRSKFQAIISPLSPLLSRQDIDASLVRAAVGCLESLLVVQDSSAWALPHTQVGPRATLVGLLRLASDHRPKVRKRVIDAIQRILQNPPPGPLIAHPAATLCAETAVVIVKDVAERASVSREGKAYTQNPADLIHSLHLVKVVATSSGGWPGKNVELLCGLLLNITKSSNEYLTKAVFDLFDSIFEIVATQSEFQVLIQLIDSVKQLQPSGHDSQLLPQWIAVVSRAYDVASQTDPVETFQMLPNIFRIVSEFLSSSSHNIRISASECLISFLFNCVPNTVLLEPSPFDEKVVENLAGCLHGLLDLKFQSAWVEVFNVVGAFYDVFRWLSSPLLDKSLRIIGLMRTNEAFNGKKDADKVLGKAIKAISPESFLNILPLNLLRQNQNEPGRAWLLPLLRDNIQNSSLRHFKSEFIPLSELLFQKANEHNLPDRNVEIKIYETLVRQIWSLFPGYCNLPTDLIEGFDQIFAEMLANLLYTQVDLRVDVCKGLQHMVESNQAIINLEGPEELVKQRRTTKLAAQKNLDHLGQFSSNLLAVLFNVYTQTLPHHRSYILNCINAYLSIVPKTELDDTFTRITTNLESELATTGPQTQAAKQKHKKETGDDLLPPVSHTLIDLVITMSVYLPRESFSTLFSISALTIAKENDPQLQKKAYKMIPRLASTESGSRAISERSDILQKLLVENGPKTSVPARRDRLAAINEVIQRIPSEDLSFIPTILSEVILSCKETNQKARTQAFDLLVSMGERMKSGGVIRSANVPHLPADTPDTEANIEEYFTMIFGGLAEGQPQVISATVIALTRCLYEFWKFLGNEKLKEAVSTLDLFLTSPSREIVKSVLGFIKVAMISLPVEVLEPLLPSLIPNLMKWSHEHNNKFRAKVKHIVERMIRRFGIQPFERYTPQADKKLIVNIRKARERKKRRGDGGRRGESSEDEQQPRAKKFDNEYDNAIYDSSSEDDDGNDGAGRKGPNRGRDKDNRGTFIIEDEDEPLDLLSKSALANISTTKPLRPAKESDKKRSKAKVNIDGKLVIGMDEEDSENQDDPSMELDKPQESQRRAPDAYTEAITGKHSAQRGQRGKLKFKNRKSGDEMEVDEDEFAAAMKNGTKAQPRSPLAPKKGVFKRPVKSKSKIHDFKKARRGLGVPKTRAN